MQPKPFPKTAHHPVLSLFAFLLLFSVFLSSCADTRKISYFEGVTDNSIKYKDLPPEPVIQTNDILSIQVTSLNPEASAMFNAPNQMNAAVVGTATYTNTGGYLVNSSGNIQFPVLGTIRAEGLTKAQLTQNIYQQLTEKKLLVDPIITIRHLNFKVSVLGEVAHPGVFPIANEKVNIMEALGLAGDITIYGKKENVMLIREDDKGEKTIKRINLTSTDILSSPYYALRSNDIVYVEPLKDRVQKEKNAQMLPIIFSLVSLTIVILDRVKF